MTKAHIFNFTGYPALAMPCGFNSEGLPAGLQIMGKPFMEKELLTIATIYERSEPYYKKLSENQLPHTYINKLNKSSISIKTCEEVGTELKSKLKKKYHRYYRKYSHSVCVIRFLLIHTFCQSEDDVRH